MPPLSKAESLKYCPKCESYLPLNRFSNNQSNSDGLASYCKVCYQKIQKRYLQSMKEIDQDYKKKVAEIQLRLLHLTTAKNALKRSNYLKNDIQETIEKIIKALSTNQVDLLYQYLCEMIDIEIKVQEDKYCRI